MQLCPTKTPPATTFDPTKPAIQSILCLKVDFISNCGDNFEKTVTFDNKVSFIDEGNIVSIVDYDCNENLHPEGSNKV